MVKNSSEIDIFNDGMGIFLSYISRQIKKDPTYNPHPLIRAFEYALHCIKKIKDEECTIGASQDNIEDKIYNPYVVVLKKKSNNRIEVMEIRNLQVNKGLSLDIMILTFRIQIHLDKIEGNDVTPFQMVSILNKVIPGNNFYALGDRWEEARDEFIKLINRRVFPMPTDTELLKEISEINETKPWEEYSNKFRCLVGGALLPSLLKEGIVCRVIIPSPKNSKIKKLKVFETATEFLLGEIFNQK